MKLNKDKWVCVKINDIVENISERIEPTSLSYEKYVGLEHLETGKIKISKYGSSDDVIGTKIKACKGDIIFGKRRAYQRKAGLLEFDAICSAHSFILRAKKNQIDQYFLLHFIHSDKFMQRAVEISEGSLSPTIKWKSLSTQEFKIPPLSEQKYIADIFQIFEQCINQVEEQVYYVSKFKRQLLRELFEGLKLGNYLTKDDYHKVKFEKIVFQISERVDPKQTELDTYVGLEHLEPDNLVIETTGKPSDVIGTKLKIYKDDIIFGKRRAYQRKVAVSHFDGIASAHSMILRANESNIEKEFLPYFMQSDTFMDRAIQISEGSLSPTIKWKTLACQEFILPNKGKQKYLIDIFKQFDISIKQLKQQKTDLKNLKQKLLNEILG